MCDWILADMPDACLQICWMHASISTKTPGIIVASNLNKYKYLERDSDRKVLSDAESQIPHNDARSWHVTDNEFVRVPAARPTAI